MSWSQKSLTVKQRNAVLKAIKAEGKKPPKVGYCVRALGGEVCRHPKSRYLKGDTGYQVISVEKPAGFDGARRRLGAAYPLAKNIKSVKLRRR